MIAVQRVLAGSSKYNSGSLAALVRVPLVCFTDIGEDRAVPNGSGGVLVEPLHGVGPVAASGDRLTYKFTGNPLLHE
jgi:hypothetical protein